MTQQHFQWVSEPYLFVAAAVLATAAGFPAFAEERSCHESTPVVSAGQTVETTEAAEEARAAEAAWLKSDPLSSATSLVDSVRQPLEPLGIEIDLGVTSVFQAATDSLGPRTPVLWSFSYDFCGEWTLVKAMNSVTGTGTLGWHLEGGRPIGERRDTDLSAEVGSILGINDDLDGEPVALTELWWQQRVLDNRLTITLGKIDPTCFYDANRVANCEMTQFLATPLVNNSAVAFPDNGLGVNVTFEPVEWCYVSAGMHDAHAVSTQSGFNTIDESEFFYAGEIGFRPVIGDLPGNYRFMAWTTEIDDGHGRGFALSFDQEIIPGTGVIPFFRYGYSDGEVTDFDHQISVGVGFEGLVSGRDNDLLAIGYVWSDPSDATLRQESLVEMFYRMQLTQSLQLTPDVQVIFDPANNADHDVVAVFGLRLQMDF